jgi:excisionase family DNA binding protein
VCHLAIVKKEIDFSVLKCKNSRMEEDRLLTKKEVSEYLRVSRSTLDHRLMKEIPYIKLGKRVLFRKSVIDKYLEKKTVNK